MGGREGWVEGGRKPRRRQRRSSHDDDRAVNLQLCLPAIKRSCDCCDLFMLQRGGIAFFGDRQCHNLALCTIDNHTINNRCDLFMLRRGGIACFGDRQYHNTINNHTINYRCDLFLLRRGGEGAREGDVGSVNSQSVWRGHDLLARLELVGVCGEGVTCLHDSSLAQTSELIMTHGIVMPSSGFPAARK